MMNYKEKAIEIATNGASIAFGLILFLAILVGVPAVFVGLYLAIKVAALAYFYLTIHREIIFYGLFIPVLICLVWIVVQLRADHRNRKNKGGDS